MSNQLRTVKKNLLLALMAFHGHDLTRLGQALCPAVSKCYLSHFINEYAHLGSRYNPLRRQQICELYHIEEDLLFPQYDPATMDLPLIEEDRRALLETQEKGDEYVHDSSKSGASALR
jgi:hypothetical protein